MQKTTSNHRLAEIDFLRGLAVILVLFSHCWLTDPTKTMGWIGVDLFFVLSGFLVSGLLFNEYKKYGSVDAKRFLIRRGFKIYPSFYISIFATTILLAFFPYLSFFPDAHLLPDAPFLVLNGKGLLIGFLVECLFLQSYFLGFWGHHWSLAVEEHFYIFLVLLVTFLIRRNRLNTRVFIGISIFIFGSCLAMRVLTNLYNPALNTYSATHLRMDSLFAGVLVSYFFNFHNDQLRTLYVRYRLWLVVAILPLLSFTPFVNVFDSIFVRTIGFSMLAVAFCFLLLVFLFEKNIGDKVARVIGKPLYGFIATKIGFYSYGIYLFHMYVVRYVIGEEYPKHKYSTGEWSYWQVVLSFCIYFVLSLSLGILLSKMIETPMLRLRDRWYPRRAPAPLAQGAEPVW